MLIVSSFPEGILKCLIKGCCPRPEGICMNGMCMPAYLLNSEKFRTVLYLWPQVKVELKTSLFLFFVIIWHCEPVLFAKWGRSIWSKVLVICVTETRLSWCSRTPTQGGLSREGDLGDARNCKAQAQISLQTCLDSGLKSGLQLSAPLLDQPHPQSGSYHPNSQARERELPK